MVLTKAKDRETWYLLKISRTFVTQQHPLSQLICIRTALTVDPHVCAEQALEHTPRAVSVARRVLEDCPHSMLVGTGADRFAAAQGFANEVG